VPRYDPYRNFHFRVEIDGHSHAGFSDVEIGASTVDVIEYREGNEQARVRKLSGLRKYANVTLKRGFTASMDLFNWFQSVAPGDPSSRKDVTIVLLGEDGSDQARFVVRSAWPTKFAVGALHAKGNEVVIETLELVNEGIERVA
jgi:phage tail-like protein